jgi:hypothetical protein
MVEIAYEGFLSLLSNHAAETSVMPTSSRTETRPVLFVTYAYNDPDSAPVEDVSGSLKETRYWMRGRSGFVYRVERQADGTYGQETFVKAINQ